VLLVGAGLLVRSFIRVLQVKPGFDAHHVLTAKLSVPENRYPRAGQLGFYRDLAPRIAVIPGVESVSASWPLPLSGSDISVSFDIEGQPTAPGAQPSEFLAVATPDFFRTMRIPVRAGREFTDADTTESKPVIIVNEAFERKYFGGQSALGKHIKSGISDGTVKSTMREIVGVVGSVKRHGLKETPVPQYYLPWTQAEITWPTLVIRTSVDPASITGALRAKVAELDREVPMYGVATLEDRVYKAAAEPRFETLLFGCFAGMALLLATVGLYAVLSYSVSQRAGEIGVRMALGASRASILSLILNRGVALAVTGIVIGLAGSAVLTEHLSGMLYGIQPLDTMTFASVSAILLAISMGASVVPAFRAARVDPMRVLREQ
jgi:putative ABC transport system permease protein